MKAGDVTDTLELALAASGCDQAPLGHRAGGQQSLQSLALLAAVLHAELSGAHRRFKRGEIGTVFESRR